MKYPFALLALCLAFSSCSSSQQASRPHVQTEAGQNSMTAITGQVVSVQPQKDGYTVQLLTPDKTTYVALISLANLKDHQQYRLVKAGETITVEGEVWQLGNEPQITVRALK